MTRRIVPVSLFALAIAGADLAAQQNVFVVFPQDPLRQAITAASYVRRPDWNLAGEAFQEVKTDWFRGVGNLGGGALAWGVYHWAGDLDSSTVETYDIVLRSEDTNAGGPDTTPAGVIVEVTGLTLPTTTTGGNSGWILSDNFATPAIVPTNATWFQGLRLPQNLNWPASDGHSIWAADTLAANTPATVGENPRQNAPPVTWGVDASGGSFQTQWTYVMGTLVANPTFHLGGIDPSSTRTGTGIAGDPSYGMAGLFPDISGQPRSDGLNMRLEDGFGSNLLALFFGGTAWAPQPQIQVPGFAGDIQIDLAGLVPLGFAPTVNGVATMPLAAPGSISPALIGGELMFQGVMYDPATGTGSLSNAQVTQF
ncbi:MAG: hypothetical protein KAI24_01925 [Planctomycetes bacterium]|nr:hypothetical protein [Planctomycetota bacterium]